MRNDKLSTLSMDFIVAIINLVKNLKESKEHIAEIVLQESDVK